MIEKQGYIYQQNSTIIKNFNIIVPFIEIKNMTKWQILFDRMINSGYDSDLMELYGNLIRLNIYIRKYDQ